MENEVFPLKAALSQIKEENILLHEKVSQLKYKFYCFCSIILLQSN